MDTAVALVRAYLQLNGYFTITEYPVVRRVGANRFRSLTDVDVIAFHFPYGEPDFETDRVLDVPSDTPDMIIGEVKEGRAVINDSANDPEVIAKVLKRFGCCTADEAMAVGRRVVAEGSAKVNLGHRVRLVAFGSSKDEPVPYEQVMLSDVVSYLDRYIEQNWEAVKVSGSKDQVFSMMLMLAKARQGVQPR